MSESSANGYYAGANGRSSGENQMGLDGQSLKSSMRREAVEIDPLAMFASQSNNSSIKSGPSSGAVSPPPPPLSTNSAFTSLNSGNSAGFTGLESDISPATMRPPLVDVVELMTGMFISSCRTNPLDVKSVTSNSASVQTLARANAWKHVLTSSSRFITAENPGYNSGSLTLVMKLRLEALFRLKMFDELSQEATKILASEEKRLANSYSAAIGTGSNNSKDYNCDLSVSMKLLLAEVKSITGRNEEALEMLYVLRETLSGVANNIVNGEYWLWRVRNSIVHTAIRQRNWRISINEVLSMANSLKDTLDQKIQTNSDHVVHVRRAYIVMLTRLARLFTQIGDMKSATFYCEKSIEQVNLGDNLGKELFDQVQLTRGIIKFTSNKYDEAFSIFTNIIERDKARQQKDTADMNALFGSALSISDSSISSTDGETVDFLSIFDSDDSLASSAANNYAVCALYLRRVKDAVSVLESYIMEDPARNFNDAIVFNLCTLYDLSCAPELSSNKKKVLHKVAQTYSVEDPYLNWKSSRLS